MSNGEANGNGGWGRKFWFVVGIYCTNLGAFMAGKLSEPTYLTIVLSVIGGYLVANVAQKVMNK